MPLPAAEADPLDDGLAILLPVYNDWAALRLLLADLDAALTGHALRGRIVVIDDASTIPADDADMAGPFAALGRIDVVELRRNLGHQRAIAIGLSHVEAAIPCRALVVMDSDGEDAPADVPRLLRRMDEEGGRKIVFAERTRRSESWTFLVSYTLFRLAHVILTGHAVRVGNFSAIPRVRLASLVSVSEIWNH
jgi:glycosyltransferase involved in cell wall biosynthesis